VIPLSINGVVGQGFGGTASTTSASITVPSTGGTACTDLLGPFAYGSTLTVTETAPAGTALASAAVTGNATGSATVSAGNVASFVVGRYGSTDALAILTLTNAAVAASPPPPPPTGGSTSGGGASGGSTSGGSTSGGSTSGGSTSGGSTSGGSTSGGSTSGGSTSGGSTSGTGNTSSLTGTPSVVKSPVVVKLVAARFVVIAHGKLAGRWLGVQLKGNTPTAKVKILLVGRNHQVIGTLTRTVKTGQFVRVAKVAKSVLSVKVSPLSV
jgi:hypothetical protein